MCVHAGTHTHTHAVPTLAAGSVGGSDEPWGEGVGWRLLGTKDGEVVPGRGQGPLGGVGHLYPDFLVLISWHPGLILSLLESPTHPRLFPGTLRSFSS